jgi:hypothetical protein
MILYAYMTFYLNYTQRFHTACTSGVCWIRPFSVRRDLLAVTSAWRLLSQSTTSSAKRSYNNIIHSCVLQRSILIGSTVDDVIFSVPHFAKALLTNIPYRCFFFLRKEVRLWNWGTKCISGVIYRHIPAHFEHCPALILYYLSSLFCKLETQVKQK